MKTKNWPVLRHYPSTHLRRIALPLGGIGTGTVSLGGRGNLRDWEIMNRPAKGFTPTHGQTGPFFALYAKAANTPAVTRVLEGPLDDETYEGPFGAQAVNHGLPRFRNASFAAAYPLGQVLLSDPEVPLRATLQAFNPLVPCAVDDSSWPVAVLRFQLYNPGRKMVSASICGSLPNFIGQDGSRIAPGPDRNRNIWRTSAGLRGIFMLSEGLEPACEQKGTLAMACLGQGHVSHRTAWQDLGWGAALLDFWDDFSADGRLDEPPAAGQPAAGGSAMASLAMAVNVPPQSTRSVTFLMAWHFPNRYSWTPRIKVSGPCRDTDRSADWVGNHYTSVFSDAWDAAERFVPRLADLELRTIEFVETFCAQDLPLEVREAALFNLSTLRSQTCFRTADGLFFGFEGCGDHEGSCMGSCTHVWNYEQTVPFLFGSVARTMREIEFGRATDENGLMSFRVCLPMSRAQEFGKAAADGQMGTVLRLYRDWQLSGDDDLLKRLWPKARKVMEFCWIKGGWDADRDGVMEGCQHNTMDVEYFGPNPQMQGWYLGALRAAGAMARFTGEIDFADECGRLFDQGRAWMDAHLFNGAYYEQEIRPPANIDTIAPSLLVGMGSKDITKPDYQIGAGCLVDQLVGQFMAHICGLGYLHAPDRVRRTLKSIYQYNRRADLSGHFNCMRSFALGSEAALLMAGYPGKRPANPFPYFTEVMTGFEYTAAIGMLYEGQTRAGLQCIRDVRARYDGRKRNPFNEAECGHHYARAMAAWGAVLALTGFHYSAVLKQMVFAPWNGKRFWSTGYAWGECRQASARGGRRVLLTVRGGELPLQTLQLSGFGEARLSAARTLKPGQKLAVTVKRAKPNRSRK